MKSNKTVKHYKLAKLTAALLIAGCLWASCKGRSESWLRHRSVKLTSGRGGCSGEQVRSPHGEDYILTAGHCKVLEVDGSINVTDEDGTKITRRVIAEDPNSDLLLLEGLPGVRGIDIADSSYAKEHVRTFTHGSLMDTYKTEGELVQNKQVDVIVGMITNSEEAAACVSKPKNIIYQMPPPFDFFTACIMSTMETVSTAPIVPGSSGGMVVDDSGKLVGVASASDEHFYYFVRLQDIKAFLSGY